MPGLTLTLYYSAGADTSAVEEFRMYNIRIRVIATRWREVNTIPALYHDPWFRLRKLHFMLKRAQCAAFCIDARQISSRSGYGFASRRDELPYLIFRNVQCVYGPDKLHAVQDIVCSGMKIPVSFEIGAELKEVKAVQPALLTFMNQELHKTFVYKARTLSDGVYVTNCNTTQDEDGKCRMELMCRRTDDRAFMPSIVKRFLSAKLGNNTLSVRIARDSRRDLGEQIADLLNLHYGSWLLIPPGFGEVAVGGKELRMKMQRVMIRNARHPNLKEMYLKPSVDEEEWRPRVHGLA